MKTQINTPNMETGSIPRLLAQLAVPAVVAQIINLLYNIVDRIYIGHIPGIGAAALTGVGLFAPILMLLNAFAMLVGSGGAPRAAIAMGKKDNASGRENPRKLFYFVSRSVNYTDYRILCKCTDAAQTLRCQRCHFNIRI